MKNILATLLLAISISALGQGTIYPDNIAILEYCEGCMSEEAGSETTSVGTTGATIYIDEYFSTLKITGSYTSADGVFKLSDLQIWTDEDAVVVQGIASNSDGKYVFLLNGDYNVFSMREYTRGDLGVKSYKFY